MRFLTKKFAVYSICSLLTAAGMHWIPVTPFTIEAQAHHGGSRHCGSRSRVSPGWRQDGTGWRYQCGDGTYCHSGMTSINGNVYAFDSNGYRQTGWVQSGEDWYYFNDNGNMVTGEYEIEGNSYYFNDNGCWNQGCGYYDSNGHHMEHQGHCY